VLCDGRKRRKLRQGGLWTSGGQILYLIMYDTNSTMARKNPVEALDAYKKAFPVEDEHVGW
ncbi:MAG: hypothetical protein V8T24_09325, partial [Roseburia hominis]